MVDNSSYSEIDVLFSPVEIRVFSTFNPLLLFFPPPPPPYLGNFEEPISSLVRIADPVLYPSLTFSDQTFFPFSAELRLVPLPKGRKLPFLFRNFPFSPN